jgi:hypothetical protein
MFDEMLAGLDDAVMQAFAQTVPVQYQSKYADGEISLNLIKDNARTEDDRPQAGYLVLYGSRATFPLPPTNGDYLRTADGTVYAVMDVEPDCSGFTRLLAQKR